MNGAPLGTETCRAGIYKKIREISFIFLSFILDGADGDFFGNFFSFFCVKSVTNLCLIILDFSVRVEFLLKTDLSFDNHQIMNRVFIEN